MSVVKINAIDVSAGAGPELAKRFAARAGMVDTQPGFEEFMLLRPTAGEDRYFVLTRWESEEAFQAWRSGQAFQHGHAQARGDAQSPREGGASDGASGQAPPPVTTGASLLEFEVVSLTTAPGE